ncbi:MucR family transcriptional regulator [Sphingomonas abietis]|uniref:MucR family transcriptional regulator n=1 Tax=Sphingomonas abietis TaxID=3012344 RepID=A0ABY7NSC9_9SPHN|nr:MucR family transcriptional regulator [Sphingomonas abietis]WBO24474.1 MucR family transcriptional regulator [Sphingomonas abietis]
MPENNLIELTADIVSAHVSHNSTATTDLPNLIQSVFAALSATAHPVAPEMPKQEPAVSVRASVKHDYIVCLEDGAKLKMLKRYLRTNFNMSPEEYRAKWELPRDYPMVAPAYSETRRALAHSTGLGRKTDVAPAPKTTSKLSIAAAKEHLSGEAPAAKKRGRPAKTKAAAPAGASETAEA